MKKFISFVTSLTVAASVVAPAITAAASDFLVYADYLAGKSVIKKMDEAGYRLEQNITRAEMAKVAANLAKLELKPVDGKVFGDVSANLGDLAQYIEAMAAAGYVAKNPNFRPMDLVTRAEMVKMLLKAKGVMPTDEDQGFADIANIGDLAGYVNAAAKAGLVSKNMYFRPVATASRGEVFKVAAKADGFVETDDLGLGDLFGTGTTSTGTTSTGVVAPAAAGDLAIALNPTTLASGTQIPKVGIVKFAVVDLKAGGADISLNSIELKKVGLASVASSTKVWFEKAGARLSSKTSFTSEGNAVVSFAPAFVVKAGSTESVELYVELNGDSGVDYQFASAAVVSSAKTVAGSFTTPTLRTTNYDVASAAFGVAGTSGTVYKASNDVIELGAFKVVANDTKSETTDVKFQSISLNQSGSADLANLSDIVLVRNGAKVSTSTKVEGKVLTFTLADVIKESTTATYYIKAKVINVENQTDVYQFRLKNTSDLNAIEAVNGFRTTVTDINGTSFDAATEGNLYSYSVNGGDVKFERDSSVALSSNVAPGTSNVVLMQGSITAKNAVRLEDVRLYINTVNSGSTAGNLNQFFNTLYLQIGSSSFSVTATGAANDYLDFNGTVNVSGTVAVKLYGNLKDTAPNGTVKFTEMKLDSFVTTKEYVANQEAITSSVGTIAGVSVTIDKTSLNVTRTDNLGATNVASGSKGVTLYGAQLSSTKGNPISVTAVTFNVASNNTGSTAANGTGVLNNVYATLYVDGTPVTSKTIDATTLKFDGFSSVVSSTKSVSMVVKADFSEAFSTGTLALNLASLAAVDNVSSKDVTGYATPAGAVFSVMTANAELSVADANPLANLFAAASTNNKLFAFKVKAKNDSVKVKDVNLTGTGLDALTNYRLTDAAGNVIATSSSESATAVAFESAQSTAIAPDAIANYFVVADAKSNTNTGGIQLSLASGTGAVKITGTNGSDVYPTLSSAIVSKAHGVAESTLVIAKQAITSGQSLSARFMEFTVAANGTKTVTLSGFTFDTNVTGYTSTGTVKVYRNSVEAANEVTSSANNTVDPGNTVKFIVVVEGATMDATANTISYELKLSDVETTDISSVKVYNNLGALPFVETIK